MQTTSAAAEQKFAMGKPDTGMQNGPVDVVPNSMHVNTTEPAITKTLFRVWH